ncbi:hypothetical protein [Ligilactobacillus pobuzihii]|uniref:LXG domain-containing protein n=1 Tax=Ligilactobacillus pobuzihii TaxID=449659 RepID=A0A0R2LLP0_9LACO|nr:hypothetical protein [Ligilactobacillus pobuzihii]KRK08960.1 hypothetical protein FD11_GL001626 [Ligilactobacillus pobuzihii E100301 = KCTC 13174]KRN99597.1 hypothetical protein IV66_GL001603 [Ligilactobacillus pobuzihii]
MKGIVSSDALFHLHDSFTKEIEKFKTTVHENDNAAVIDTASFGELEGKFSTAETDFAALEKKFSKVYTNINDIVAVSSPSSANYVKELNAAKKVLTNTEKWLAEINGDKLGAKTSELLSKQGKELKQLGETEGHSFSSAAAKEIYTATAFQKQVKKSHAATAKLEKSSLAAHQKKIKQEGYQQALINGDLTAKDIDQLGKSANKNAKDAYKQLRDMAAMIGRPVTAKSFKKYGSFGKKTNELLMKDYRDVKRFLRTKKDSKAAQRALKVMGKGSFNEFLAKNAHKLKNYTKAWKNYDRVEGWVSDTGGKVAEKFAKSLPKVKGLGKLAKATGWTAMAGSAAINGGESFLDKKSKGYHSVGKSVIHAGVESVKSAGPVEGAMTGAKVGTIFPLPGATAIGAGVGFLIGGASKIWGAASPKTKTKFFNSVEKFGDKVHDKVIGKLAKKLSGHL